MFHGIAIGGRLFVDDASTFLSIFKKVVKVVVVVTDFVGTGEGFGFGENLAAEDPGQEARSPYSAEGGVELKRYIF